MNLNIGASVTFSVSFEYSGNADNTVWNNQQRVCACWKLAVVINIRRVFRVRILPVYFERQISKNILEKCLRQLYIVPEQCQSLQLYRLTVLRLCECGRFSESTSEKSRRGSLPGSGDSVSIISYYCSSGGSCEGIETCLNGTVAWHSNSRLY